jgi:hypothetical protein
VIPEEQAMTREEHYAVNMAAYYSLKGTIDSKYPAKQFVAIAGGKIVADDANFDKLQEKLAALGVGRMEALVDRAGDPIPTPVAFPGTLTLSATGRLTWNFETRTGA